MSIPTPVAKTPARHAPSAHGRHLKHIPAPDAPEVVHEPDVTTESAAATSLPLPTGVTRSRHKIIWTYLLTLIAFHAMLPLAFVPWFFSWTGLALIPIGNYLFCSIGIGLCFHRTLTHQGLVMPKWLEHFFAILGVCSFMESPARWVAIHRMHHKHSDHQEDPHSPLAGFLWGHFEWLIHPNPATNTADLYDRYAKDILRDPFYMALQRGGLWMVIYLVHALMFFGAGFVCGYYWYGNLMGGLQFGSSILLWGVIFRTIYTWHITWAVNSVAHLWGYRNYRTDDSSRNNWIVALATNGEGWHNNHHADQVSASHGHRWWEMDITWATIVLLEKVGLAKNVKRPKLKQSSETSVS